MRKTFDQMVADGEARRGTGPPPEQPRFTARELMADMVAEKPTIMCAACNSWRWAVNLVQRQAQCLHCGAVVALWPELPADPEDQGDDD